MTAKNQRLPLDKPGSCQTGSFHEVFRLIDIMSKKLKTIQRHTIRESGLTPSQFFILNLLWEHDERPFKELALISHCSRATITGLIDTLEKKEHVERKPNPSDRRSLLACLTEKGRLLRQSTPETEKVFSCCCSGLDNKEFRLLGTLLKKLDRSLNIRM